MKTFTQLQQNRRVIQDFITTTLAAIPSPFSRLTYMASLRDLSSGRYEHAGLASSYEDSAIQQSLELCHVWMQCRKVAARLPLTGSVWNPIAFYCPSNRLLISRSFSARICTRCWQYS